MKKFVFFILLTVLTFPVSGQQFLWSTIKKEGKKQVPMNRVTQEVLKFYDHYKLYYDYTGYNKERFIEEVADGFDEMEDLNVITELTVYAAKSNSGYGSFVIVACISDENVDMIIFTNTPIDGDLSFQSTYDQQRFKSWFNTLIEYAVIETVGEEFATEPNIEEKVFDSNAFYPGSSSQESKEDIVGGTVDSKALFRKSGGGEGGASLDLAGWRWDYEPRPNDNTMEEGRIVFEIKVDDNGEVIGVRTIETTIGPTIEQFYRQEVEKLTFSPLSGNTIPAPISTGKITFIIRSK